MWYIYHSAPAHFSRVVRDVLSNTCHDRWIGRRGLTAWPPRPPHLNLLNIYLWGHLRALVYAAPVDNEVALQIRTVDACRTLCNNPGVFERMRGSMMRHVEVHIKSHGGHIGHVFQKYCFSCNSQIKCFRTHFVMDTFFLFWHVELVPKVCSHLSVTPCISGQVGFVVDKVALGQVFSEYFGFPCQSSFHRIILHPHNHPGQAQ
jgi:hypothetical protein